MAKKETNQTELNTTTEYNKNITDFFDGEYKEWAKSVVEERALPSVIDGFKPTARKIVHAANVGSLKDGKLYKLLALSGDSMKLSLYSHGDQSLSQVAINLCKSFNDNFNNDGTAGYTIGLYFLNSLFINLLVQPAAGSNIDLLVSL